MKAALRVGTCDWCHPIMKLREGWGIGYSMQTINRAKIASSLQNTEIEDEKAKNYNPESGVVRCHDGGKKTNSEEGNCHASCSITW